MNHTATNWALSLDEYEKYTSIFIASDSQNCGILSGGQARELLSQSGLPPHVLFQVWNLADPQQTGFLDPPRFAVAMHLIFQKLAGHNLPLQLPSELQPQKLQHLQTGGSPITVNKQSVQPNTFGNPNSDIDKRISSLEIELNKKRLLVAKIDVPPPLNNFELSSLMNKVKEQHLKIPFFSKKENISLDFQWTSDLSSISKLESDLPLLSSIDALLQESKSVLNDILSSGRELFALEDAQTHGYILPAEGAKLPTIPLPTGGDSVIAQKAAAMLAQRVQALQLSSTVGPIPSDAQRRLEAHQSVLESQKNSAVSRLTNLNNSIRSDYQTFQTKLSQYKTGSFGADGELRREFDRWRNYNSSTSSSTTTFINQLTTDNLPKTQHHIDSLKTKTQTHVSIPDSPASPILRVPSPSSILPAKPLARLKPSFPEKKPPPPQRSAPKPNLHSKSAKPSLSSGVPPSKPSLSTSINIAIDPPADDFAAIAQASRLARAKAQQLERSQSLSDKPQSRNKPIPKRPPPTPLPKITSEELSRQQDQQQGPSVGEIRAAARRARALAQSNLEATQDISKSDNSEEPIVSIGHTKKSSVSQLAADFSSVPKNHIITSSSAFKKVSPPPLKQKPTHLQYSSKIIKSPETLNKVLPISHVKSKLNYIVSKGESKSIQQEPKDNTNLSEELKAKGGYLGPLPELLDTSIKDFTQAKETETIYHDAIIPVHNSSKQATSIESSSSRHSLNLNSPIEANTIRAPEENISDNTLSVHSTQNNSQTSFENIPSPENPWSVKALYDYVTDDGFSFTAGSTVLITELPSDAPGWCLGHANDRTGWIPKTYLDLPDSTGDRPVYALDTVHDSISLDENHLSVPEDTSAIDSDITVQNETISWATLFDNFTAEVEGGEHIEFEAGQVQILDTSNPDWYLARHPDFGSLAYLPVDILSYSSTSNPFARQSNNEDQNYSCYSDTDASELHSTESMRKAHSAHHLPLHDYQEASSPHRLGWASQVDSTVLEGMSKTEIQRLEAVHELVTTEKTYLRDMQLVVDVFYLPLEQQAEREELALIFANLPELVVVNTLFLSELESVGTEGVGAAFLSHVSEFQAYGPYCGNQAAASRYLQTNHPYVHFLKEASNRPECRMLSLASFLLQPVQRITRYPLLLKQIYKYTPQSYPEYSILQEAISKAESTLEQINREAYENENIQQLREMETRIDLSAYPNFRLSDLTRHLGPRQAIIDGPLSKHKSSRALHGFLFNDVFLLAQTKSSGVYQFELYRPPMSLNRLKVRDAQTSQGRRGIFSPYDDTCFQVVLNKEILTLKATTASTKKKWLTEFNKAIKSAAAHGSSH